MAKNKVSVSFSGKYIYLYDYLKAKDNISNYICQLIESDIEHQNSCTDLEGQVIEIVNRLLKDKQFVNLSPSTNPELTTDIIRDEDIDTIKNLF